MIKLTNVSKRYPSGNLALDNVSLDIDKGEFVFIVGSSGAGKSTLMRLLLREETPTSGRVIVNGRNVGEMKRRDIPYFRRTLGVVFQDFRLIPTMNVYDNVAFALRATNVSNKDIRQRVPYILNLVGLQGKARSMPEQISGGEQQRVALARALVIHPDVLLMDEPLSNLDAKLRVEMRSAIKDIQNQVGITTVYVTHDQEEAMAVSDRIAVFNHGVIQQIGTPQQLYQRPKNLFTATFIGRTNIVEGTLTVGENGTGSLVLARTCGADITGLKGLGKGTYPVKVSVRPEEFVIHESGKAGAVEAVVESSIFLGLNTHYNVRLATGERVDIIQESTIDHIIKPQTKISLTVKQEKINILSEDGSRNYLVGVEDDEE